MKNQNLWKKFGDVLSEAHGWTGIDRQMETIVRCKYCGIVLITKPEMELLAQDVSELTGVSPKELLECNDLGEATVDHIVPQSLGGTNDIENLVPCCRSCNSKKGARNSLTVEMKCDPISDLTDSAEALFILRKKMGQK